MDTWICRQVAPSLLWVRLRICRLLWTNSTSVEIVIAWMTLACGAQLARTEPLFDHYTEAYARMAELAPEPAWATILLILGSCLGTSLLIGSRRGRRVALMGMVVLWWAIAGLFWTAIPGGMMPPITSVMAAASTWAFARLGRRE